MGEHNGQKHVIGEELLTCTCSGISCNGVISCQMLSDDSGSSLQLNMSLGMRPGPQSRGSPAHTCVSVQLHVPPPDRPHAVPAARPARRPRVAQGRHDGPETAHGGSQVAQGDACINNLTRAQRASHTRETSTRRRQAPQVGSLPRGPAEARSPASRRRPARSPPHWLRLLQLAGMLLARCAVPGNSGSDTPTTRASRGGTGDHVPVPRPNRLSCDVTGCPRRTTRRLNR